MQPDLDLSALSDLLEADGRFAAAIVFGSVARGAARPDSDLDLAVLYAGEGSRNAVEADFLAVLGRLGTAARRDVHLVDLERADPALRRTVLNTGHVLLDRVPGRLRDIEVATGIECFDWEYARRVMDAAQARRLGADRG